MRKAAQLLADDAADVGEGRVHSRSPKASAGEAEGQVGACPGRRPLDLAGHAGLEVEAQRDGERAPGAVRRAGPGDGEDRAGDDRGGGLHQEAAERRDAGLGAQARAGEVGGRLLAARPGGG